MEALVAVGLAANVLQFVDFTAEIIGISNELRNNAASSENRDHQAIATHLKSISQNISNSNQAISQSPNAVSPEEKALQPVAKGCCALAEKLLEKLHKCSIQPGQNVGRLKRARVAFKTIWNKQEIAEISRRLEYFRNQLNLYYTTQLCNAQRDAQEKQSNKDDIQAICGRLADLGRAIEKVMNGITDKIGTQHSETIESITEARSENVQLHSQAAQQNHADQSRMLQKLDDFQSTMLRKMSDMQASLMTLSVGAQNIPLQQTSTIEPLAQVKVQGSTFLAGVTQQVPLANDSGNSLRHVLQPLFEHYRERLLVNVDKRFRVAFRSGMDSILQEALPALDEIQYRSRTTQRDNRARVSKVTTKRCQDDCELQTSSELQKLEFPNSPTHGKFDKNSLTTLRQQIKRVENESGVLSLFIIDRVCFNTFGNRIGVHELTAQFDPSPYWLSSGCSIVYESRTDARGHPQFGLRLQSHRVIDDNHEAWKAIRKGDISRIRDMLSQKIISTSDRDADGFTLLHYAVVCGQLEICKTLVQSGADINAFNSFGISPLGVAIIPNCSRTNRQGTAIFHYLSSSCGAEPENPWVNDDLVILFAISAILDDSDDQRLLQNIDHRLRDWMSVCRSMDLDLSSNLDMGNLGDLPAILIQLTGFDHDLVLSQITFLEVALFLVYARADNLGSQSILFDAFIRLGVSTTSSANTLNLPTACAALYMYWTLEDSFADSLIAAEASPVLSVFYRGYYVHPDVAQDLTYLECVISKGIAQRPDCIFDTFGSLTPFCKFNRTRWIGIWEEILKEHKFDLDLVYEEIERRKRVVTGETTANKVHIDVDVSKASEMTRCYENPDD